MHPNDADNSSCLSNHTDVHPNLSMVMKLTTVSLNVDDIARKNLLLLQAVVNGGVQLQLLGALHTLQANDDMCDHFAIPACLQCTSRFATRVNDDMCDYLTMPACL